MLSVKRPPVIGITIYGRQDPDEFFLQRRYVDVVRQGGGVPILLPPGELHPKRILDIVDGLIFSGGGDMDPTTYGGEPHPAIARVDPERDAFELALAEASLTHGMPVLGICRGHQVMTVVTGGKLIPHVPDAYGTDVLHRTEPERDPIDHPVHLLPGSRLAHLMGQEEINIVSWHHQAVKDVPAGWTIVGHAPDGLIEAMEYETHPWAVTVQWHPERSGEQPYHQRLFRAFVEAAGERRAS